jgi:hypothetical protein
MAPRLSLPLVLFLILTPSAFADLPQARLDRIFPLGGKAGSSVLVEVRGRDLDDLTALHFDHPGLKAELVKPNQFRIHIPPDLAPGSYEVRTVGRWGISGSRLFAVSRDLAEVLEVEPNDTPATAQKVPLGCAINGNSDNDGDDFFRFPARKGQRIVIDCQALRLDSQLRATLVLSTGAGKELARSKPYHLRTDPLLDFVAPEDGDYIVGLHDSTFTGGHPYRLVISDRPQIENVVPPAVAVADAGKTVALEVLGRNLPMSKPSGLARVLDQELEALTVSCPIPADVGNLQRFRFLQHLPSSSAKARGFQFWPPGLEQALNPATVLCSPVPVAVQRPGNHSAERAQAVVLPALICGRLDRSGAPDWYSFDVQAGGQLFIDLWCERLDYPGDLFILVLDDKGKEIAQLDDHGIRFDALDLYNRDPMGTVNIPAKGTYRLMVQERYRNGGPRFQYALQIGKAQPDFYPVVFHETNPDPTSPLVRAGGSAAVEVVLNRRNLPGPVVVEAEGLPPGVSCPPVHVGPGNETGPRMVFTAAPDAREWVGVVRLKATALVDGKKIEREVVPVQRRWPIANQSVSRLCRELCLAVRPGAPYGVSWTKEEVQLPAGGAVEARLRVRRQGEFKGAVKVSALNPPSGFNIAPVEVAAGKEEATVTIKVGNVAPGSYSLVLRGEGQVPFQKDEKTPAKTIRVADPVTPLLVVVTAAKK